MTEGPAEPGMADESNTAAASGGTSPAAEADGQHGTRRSRLITGPGLLLLWLYGVMVVGALSRSVYQMSTELDRAPLAYSLSALAAVVYAFITYTLVRGGEKARRVAFACCAAELAGVLIVGTWTLVDPSAFPDATVWSDFGMGYVFIPVLLPVTAMYWLRKARTQALAA